MSPAAPIRRDPPPVALAAPAAPAANLAAVTVGPNPPGRRLLLFFKLLVIPFVVVSLPTLVVGHFFGQGPRPKTTAMPSDTALAGLRDSLERAARERLPDTANPATAFGTRFEEFTLTCPSAEADARLGALRDLATRCGGTVTDQPADAAGRHLLVELDEADLVRFRETATVAVAPASPGTPAAGSSPPKGEKVFLHVTLAPVAP